VAELIAQRFVEGDVSRQVGGALGNRVASLLETALRGGAPSREAIASALHMSTSTLYRRLNLEGRS